MAETCDTVAVLLEKERHAELGAEERRRLDAHLATCPACRALQGGADLELLPLPDEPPALGWEALRQRLEAVQRRQRRELALGTLGALAFGGALVAGRAWIAGRGLDAFGAGLFVGVALVVAAVLVRAGWRAWRLRTLGSSAELVASIRGELQRKLRALRFSVFIAPVYALFTALFQPRLWGVGTPGVVLRVALVGGMVALAIYGWVVRKPRLERELRDLEGA